MVIPVAYLLAAQAAGMAIDYFGKQNAIGMAKVGADLQRREIEKQIMYSRVAAEDQSLRAMIELRKNLGSQLAMFAARGVAPGAATALFSSQSLANYNTDARMRRINQLMVESQLRAGKKISEINQQAFENQNWNAFATNSLNKLSTNPEVYKGIGESFGLNKVQGGTSVDVFKGSR